jgi:hypothetical protein
MGLIEYPGMMSLLLCTQIASLFLVVKSSLGFSSVFRAHVADHKTSLGHFKFPCGVIFSPLIPDKKIINEIQPWYLHSIKLTAHTLLFSAWMVYQ